MTTPLFIISPKKAAVLDFITFGFYGIYWTYKHWQALQEKDEAEKFPLGKFLLTNFFWYPLAFRAEQEIQAHHKHITVHPTLLTVVFLSFWLSGLFPTGWLVLFVIAGALLIGYMQTQINRAFHQGELPIRYSSGEVALLVGGGIAWLLFIISVIRTSA